MCDTPTISEFSAEQRGKLNAPKKQLRYGCAKGCIHELIHAKTDETVNKYKMLCGLDKEQLKKLVADINGDGAIKSLEGTMAIRASLGTYQIPW